MLDHISSWMVSAFVAAHHRVHREEGQTLVEYALILVLISVASIAFLVAVSGKINTVLQQIADTL